MPHRGDEIHPHSPRCSRPPSQVSTHSSSVAASRQSRAAPDRHGEGSSPASSGSRRPWGATILRRSAPHLVAAHARVCIAVLAMRGPRVPTPRSSTHSSVRAVESHGATTERKLPRPHWPRWPSEAPSRSGAAKLRPSPRCAMIARRHATQSQATRHSVINRRFSQHRGLPRVSPRTQLPRDALTDVAHRTPFRHPSRGPRWSSPPRECPREPTR